MRFAIVILIISSLFIVGCSGKKTQFTLIDPSHSGIHFVNTIIDNDSMNILDMENIYNGGGVGIGDFNNDGLQDIYFTGSMSSSKLYLNKGDFKFYDITEQAGVNGGNRWARGVSIVDINNDGLMDVYVCATLHPDGAWRENLLYINKGTGKDGIPRFENEARQYNLADTSHSTMAAFFDYDNDGDLDMYLLVNEIVKHQYPNKFRPILSNGEHPSTDKLFRNDFNDSLRHPVFTDVSKMAGVTIEGYGHGVNICDINRDGWKDIYVTNDFLSNNILYINNRNGTFTDKVRTYFKHTSENSMGQDVIDINNDGLADVVELDMNPEDNFRKKMMMNPIGYQRYQYNDDYGYQYQYVRNTLQLNYGPRVIGDSVGEPIFGDIAFSAGIAETDWSWAPVVTDFDNDGYRDIVVTNGFPKDVTDHDFIVYRNKANLIAAKRDMLDQIPEVKISNYGYRNNGNLTFSNLTTEWGLTTPSFSNGAAYGDLDNDGDMDLVVNNINDKAFLYKNNERELNAAHHYLQVQLIGAAFNKNGLGAIVSVYYDSARQQVYEYTPYRGYLSTIQNIAHFGLGNTATVDSLIVQWPTGKKQRIQNVKVDQLIKIDMQNADLDATFSSQVALKGMFSDFSARSGISLIHHDSDYVDFNLQRLLPHKLSEYGPALAVGDLNGDGLDDFVCAGSMYYYAKIFFQEAGGTFLQKDLVNVTGVKHSEDAGILLFDADNDNDVDLYIASGSCEEPAGSSAYQDRLYLNDGNGNFSLQATALPQNYTSKSCARASDIDKDGDLDLFVAGRIEPRMYPKAISSFIFRNDSKNGEIKFTDITESSAAALKNMGLVCDASFTDFDNDGWQDLVLAGEWMPVTFLKNRNGKFENVTSTLGVVGFIGWWNSILPVDLDNDGDMDYIGGNLGTNSYYRASNKYPVAITAFDFDGNGNYDAFPSLYLSKSFQHPEKNEYPAHLRDDAIRQLISLRRFQNYKQYADATMDQLLTEDDKKKALRLEATWLRSSILINDNGKFTVQSLPENMQFSSINGMIADDLDGDGNVDIVLSNNDFGTEVFVGRYDAMNGMLLMGNGKGQFRPLSILESGIFIPGNGRALVKLQTSTGNYVMVASQNKDAIKVFELNKKVNCIKFNSSDVKYKVNYKNGKTLTGEINYGSSFYSQSGRFVPVDPSVVSSVEIINSKGEKRTVNY